MYAIRNFNVENPNSRDLALLRELSMNEKQPQHARPYNIRIPDFENASL